MHFSRLTKVCHVWLKDEHKTKLGPADFEKVILLMVFSDERYRNKDEIWKNTFSRAYKCVPRLNDKSLIKLYI